MICPDCQGEFRDGITTCPECDVELISAQEAARREAEAHDLGPSATVFATPDALELRRAEGLLEEAGIPFSAHNERAMELFPNTAGSPEAGFQDARLQVPENHAARARRILAVLEDPNELPEGFRSGTAEDGDDDGETD